MPNIMASMYYLVTSHGFPTVPVIVVSFAVLWFSSKYLFHLYKLSSFPLVNDGGIFGVFSTKARNEFITDCATLIRRGFSLNPDAFRVRTDFNEVVVLAPYFAETIRGEQRLSAGMYTETELMGYIPGFEPFAFAGTHRNLLHDVITSRLNRALPKMVNYISVEATDSLRRSWTNETEWHKIPLYQEALMLVAQASIRVFLGPELCRHRRWVEINSQYTVVALGAVNELRRWPRSLIPLVHWLHPQVKATRALLNEARALLQPIHEKRAREIDADPATQTDALGWFEEVAERQPYDPTVAQLTFAVAAIHSTTDLLCQVLIDLASHPDIIQELRKELVDVLTREGWQQSAFGHLKLMDSVMKESQRLKPISRVFNKRVAMDDIELSESVKIPKGAYVVVSAHNMMDPNIYPEPSKFDAYRFIKRAQVPDLARFSSFSAVSLEHTGFGFGKHACPGRTYVTLELKILLSHIILKYDWRLLDGYKPKVFNNGFDSVTDVTAQLLIRRRKEEINILPA
ncbi:hypothetical protein ZTR_07519 [Talaromyces verruculosus]|nr:hypothetical protein ZTR_07519 [Talaromyces verruculosus]